MFLGQLLSAGKGTRSAASGTTSGTGVNACDQVGRPGGSSPGGGQTWRLQSMDRQVRPALVRVERGMEIINPEHWDGGRARGDGKMS